MANQGNSKVQHAGKYACRRTSSTDICQFANNWRAAIWELAVCGRIVCKQ